MRQYIVGALVGLAVGLWVGYYASLPTVIPIAGKWDAVVKFEVSPDGKEWAAIRCEVPAPTIKIGESYDPH